MRHQHSLHHWPWGPAFQMTGTARTWSASHSHACAHTRVPTGRHQSPTNGVVTREAKASQGSLNASNPVIHAQGGGEVVEDLAVPVVVHSKKHWNHSSCEWRH